MKRIGNLYALIYDIDNLRLADKKASRGKSNQKGVIEHNKIKEENLQTLHEKLKNKTYETSPYTTFEIFEPKRRLIYRLPYWPDRICHHAILNILEPIFLSTFTANTYSCIPARGIHKAFGDSRNAIQNDPVNTAFILKLDVEKFFPNVDHQILKGMLRKKFKDPDLLWLLDEIIDSTTGLPIGNYISSILANFYLTYFDHWLKEEKQVKHVFRYCDDIICMHGDKNYLHELRKEITNYLWDNLRLKVKSNYQVFPISRGLDFVGYKTFRTHVRLRKSIKEKFVRMIKNNKNDKSIASYYGWLSHCNGDHLFNKYIRN